MWLVLAILWQAVLALAADDSFSSRGIGVLNYETRGVSCAPVYRDPSRPGFACIDIKVTLLEPEAKDGNYEWLKDYTIPLLVLRQSDTFNFTDSLESHQYDYNYQDRLRGLDNNKHRDLVDQDSKMFILTPVENHIIHPHKYLNSNFTISSPKRFAVKESGIYCVYISPPTDMGIKQLLVSVVFKNDYGFLPYWSYVLMRQEIIALFIGIVLGALMLQAMAHYKFTVKRFNSSVVLSTIIVYIFTPFLVFLFVEWYTSNHDNTHRPNYQLFTYFLFHKLLEMAKGIHMVVINFCILLFSMGYGVIYINDKTAYKGYKQFPASRSNLAQWLLYSNIAVLITIEAIGYTLYNYKFEVRMANLILLRINPLSNELIFLKSMQSALMWCASIYGIVWYFLTVYFYFKTVNSMGILDGKYNDPFQNPQPRIVVKAFRHSLLCILGIPIVSQFLNIMFSAVQTWDITPTSGDWRTRSYLSIRKVEDQMFDQSYETFCFWTLIADVYLTMYVVYVLWLKVDVSEGKNDVERKL